tara:strand:+ start:3413 stop:3571 length:159 start_codon:yes stop_codon:yes gene_type:complete
MSKLNIREIENIVRNKLIDTVSEGERKQVMEYMFGTYFAKSNNKGKIERYYV